MFKNTYGNFAVFSNPRPADRPQDRAPVFEPFQEKKADLSATASDEPERKIYEPEHFEGHEAECDFCLSEKIEGLNSEKLKEYIIFSEILGKPKSRQRTSRH